MASQVVPADEVEVVLERALADLPAEVWRVVDLRSAGRRAPRADVVVIGPPGAFVIACARPDQRPRVRARSERQVADAAAAVRAATGVRRDEVHAVVCLTGDEHVDLWRDGVVVCAAANLLDTLALRRGLLTPDEVVEVETALRASLVGERGRASARGAGKHRG